MQSPADPRDRFTSRVEDYARARPGYPPQVVELLRREINLLPSWVIADVGSGTGISCRMFLDQGNAVVSVEPNAAMRRAAEQALGQNLNFRSIDGSAEATGLADASVDLVVAAQAFHWFDIERARAEFMRILRQPRWVALLWNDRRKTGSPLAVGFEQLLRRFGTDYAKVRHENLDEARLSRFFGPGGYRSARFANAQIFDFDGLRRRLLSASFVPAEHEPTAAPMLASLRELFDRCQINGQVRMEYDTRVLWGKLTQHPSAHPA